MKISAEPFLALGKVQAVEQGPSLQKWS